MVGREGGGRGGEGLFGRIRAAGVEKVLPFLAATSLSTEACSDKTKDVAVPNVEKFATDESLSDKQKAEDEKEVVVIDPLKAELLKNMEGKNKDMATNVLAAYDEILKGVRESLYLERMSANKAGEIRYFKKIYTNKKYRDEVRILIEKYANEYKVPMVIAKGLPALESNYDQSRIAKSSGAKGITQITADTARDNGLVVNDKIDERDNLNKNIKTGFKILVRYKNNFESLPLGLTAYSHGPTNVRRKLNTFFPKLTMSKDRTTFDEKGKVEYFKMLNNGDLNISNLYMLDPVFFGYAIEAVAISDVATRYLDDKNDHYPEVVPNTGYKTAVAQVDK